MNHRIALLLLIVFLLSACTAFNIDSMWRISQLKKMVETERVVVEQPFYKENPNKVWSFFHVYMLVESAHEMKAPNGEAFVKLLDERVAEYEQQNGRKLCLHGYNVNSRKPDIRDYNWGDWAGFWMLTVDCNP
jgi:hypothetical protein